MKRLVALLLMVMIVVSLSACTIGTKGTQNISNETQAEESADADIAKYNKDFDGMQKYLIDIELLSDKKDNNKETESDIIGAKKGVRYMINTTTFVEFYEFDTSATPDEAQNVYDSIAKDGKYTVLNDVTLKGVVSSSGKFVMFYPASNSYDFSEIEKEFKKF